MYADLFMPVGYAASTIMAALLRSLSANNIRLLPVSSFSILSCAWSAAWSSLVLATPNQVDQIKNTTRSQ